MINFQPQEELASNFPSPHEKLSVNFLLQEKLATDFPSHEELTTDFLSSQEELTTKISSQEELATKFKFRILDKLSKDPEKYNWEYIYELYVRYMQSVEDKKNNILWKDQKNISPKWVIQKLSNDFRKKYWVKNHSISYENYRNVMMNLSTITDWYNTEDGQIRWLVDNKLDINLWVFFNVIPAEVKGKMTMWTYMSIPLKVAIEVREKLKTITDWYNTEDGQIRWLVDNKLDINLWAFNSIIPKEVKDIMTEWKYMNLPLKLAIEVREKLKTITDWYNTEDGQIRWLVDNNLVINLWHFFSIIPKEVKDKMTEWQMINIPLEVSIGVREKLKTITDWYNTEDGQIRWLVDNKLDINLWHFYSVIPKEVNDKMTAWEVMMLPLQLAIEVREKLKSITDWYNTEDGQIRWLEDNKLDINLWYFFSILPKEVKDKMTMWEKMDTPLKATVDIREKLKTITDWYNTEDGQIRWLLDNEYNIHLWSFNSIIPNEVKDKMTMWQKINVPLKIAIEVREKLKTITDWYNTEDGQIRWLVDNKYNIHLWAFNSIIPKEVKDIMTEWKYMNSPLKIAIDIREKLQLWSKNITEDAHIQYLNLLNFYRQKPKEGKDKAIEWENIGIPFIDTKEKYKKSLN